MSIAVYSPAAAAKTKPVTACNTDTGDVFTYTMLVASTNDCKNWPDAKVVARDVDSRKLVFFVTTRGPMTPSAFESAVARLSDEAYGRVLDAKGRFDAASRGRQPPKLEL
jgi:hypothetical protein